MICHHVRSLDGSGAIDSLTEFQLLVTNIRYMVVTQYGMDINSEVETRSHTPVHALNHSSHGTAGHGGDRGGPSSTDRKHRFATTATL